MCEKNPIKLLNNVIENKEIKINIEPFGLMGPKRVLNTLRNDNKIVFQFVLQRRWH